MPREHKQNPEAGATFLARWDNRHVPLGIYISVPFCRSKCSFCNFASSVFPNSVYDAYVERVCAEIRASQKTTAQMGGEFERAIDSIYLGGGTPTMLEAGQLQRLFDAVRESFTVSTGSEITVECAPGTLTPEMTETLARCGVNRASLGVQSFVEEESRAVGRLHTPAIVLDDMAHLRAAGISRFNVDLIAGLPHQTVDSWQRSLDQATATGTEHVSVYMLEVDEDSRLGRELIAGGTRYHAHSVPDEDTTTDLYLRACDALNAAGICQYEISNFARQGCESRHNLKYWTREPYLGFGVDAHSFLPAAVDPYVLLRAKSVAPTSSPESPLRVIHDTDGGSRPCAVAAADVEAVRFATPDSLDEYLAARPLTRTVVSRQQAREEALFLGLRLNRGVNLRELAASYNLPPEIQQTIAELCQIGLLDYDRQHEVICLTPKGRLLSNEVFERFIA